MQFLSLVSGTQDDKRLRRSEAQAAKVLTGVRCRVCGLLRNGRRQASNLQSDDVTGPSALSKRSKPECEGGSGESCPAGASSLQNCPLVRQMHHDAIAQKPLETLVTLNGACGRFRKSTRPDGNGSVSLLGCRPHVQESFLCQQRSDRIPARYVSDAYYSCDGYHWVMPWRARAR